jgi:DNA invertase Pin-like site-specific DNA recombinase
MLCFYIEDKKQVEDKKQGVLKECINVADNVGDNLLVENVSRVKKLLKFLKDLRKNGIAFINLEIKNGAWDFKIE